MVNPYSSEVDLYFMEVFRSLCNFMEFAINSPRLRRKGKSSTSGGVGGKDVNAIARCTTERTILVKLQCLYGVKLLS